MINLKHYLVKSVPREEISTANLIKNLSVAVGVVYLIFIFLEPFDFSIVRYNKYLILLGFSFAYFITLFILLKWVYPFINNIFRINKWYYYHFLFGYFFMIIAVTIVHEVLQNYVNGLPILNLSSLFETFSHALIIGLIPTVILAFASYTKALKKELKSSTKDLTNSLKEFEQEGYLTFSSSSNKELYRFEASAIIHIDSSDNYVNVVFQDRSKAVKTELIRTTLKAIEAQLEHPFLKIHRSHIVNLNYVTKVSGNAQGMQMELRYKNEPLPVSRSYINKLKATLIG